MPSSNWLKSAFSFSNSSPSTKLWSFKSFALFCRISI